MLNAAVMAELVEHNTIWCRTALLPFMLGQMVSKKNSRSYVRESEDARSEDRNTVKSQYYYLEKAGIRFPGHFEKTEQIDRLVLVKIQGLINRLKEPFSMHVTRLNILSKPSYIRRKAY